MLIQSLGQEDPLEEGKATLSSILAWRIPWTEEAGSLQSMGVQRVGQDWSDLALTWQLSVGFIAHTCPSQLCGPPNLTATLLLSPLWVRRKDLKMLHFVQPRFCFVLVLK